MTEINKTTVSPNYIELPNTVTVGPHKVTVYSHLNPLPGSTDSTTRYGAYSHRDRAIHVWNPVGEKTLPQVRETFIHECIEAINKTYQLELDHRVISTLGVALAQTLYQ